MVIDRTLTRDLTIRTSHEYGWPSMPSQCVNSQKKYFWNESEIRASHECDTARRSYTSEKRRNMCMLCSMLDGTGSVFPKLASLRALIYDKLTKIKRKRKFCLHSNDRLSFSLAEERARVYV